VPTRKVRDELFVDLEVRGPDLELPVVKSDLFGELWAPRDLAEYTALVQSPTLSDATVSGWRGQSDGSWAVHSGAYRRLMSQPQAWVADGETVRENVLRDYEDRLLQQARLAGHGYADGRRLSDLEVLGLLQHHGAATRLLDFTENAFIALWFACRQRLDRHGIVFGVALDDAWRIARDSFVDARFSSLLEEAEGRMTYWRPSALSPRIFSYLPNERVRAGLLRTMQGRVLDCRGKRRINSN
jgi:hypothetical protein